MVDTLKQKIGAFLFPKLFKEIADKGALLGRLHERVLEDMDNMVNTRAAEIVLKMDPFEPLLKQYFGVFSEEFERPEEKLDPQSLLRLQTWGYQQEHDTSFRFLTNWIMNTFGNETVKRAAVTPERMLYGRAQIAATLLLKKEVQRLSNAYEDRLRRDDQSFDSAVATE